MLYDKNEINILLTSPDFLKSLQIKNVDDIILYNIPEERDILRILSNFNKDGEKNLHIIYDDDDKLLNI
jgi:hypothetical protein